MNAPSIRIEGSFSLIGRKRPTASTRLGHARRRVLPSRRTAPRSGTVLDQPVRRPIFERLKKRPTTGAGQIVAASTERLPLLTAKRNCCKLQLLDTEITETCSRPGLASRLQNSDCKRETGIDGHRQRKRLGTRVQLLLLSGVLMTDTAIPRTAPTALSSLGNDRLLFGIILGVLTFWLFAQTTLNIAPDMQKDLGLDASMMNIAVAITALFSGIFIVFIGGLADRIGRVRIVHDRLRAEHHRIAADRLRAGRRARGLLSCCPAVRCRDFRQPASCRRVLRW